MRGRSVQWRPLPHGTMSGSRASWPGTILVAAWLALMVIPGVAAQGALEVPAITAASAFAFDPVTGEVILEWNADERRPIGSVTKVATALVAIEHLDLDDEIVIASSDMVPSGFSAMGLQPGDTLTVRQLLTGLLVASGGDAAQALAREAGGRLSGSDDPAAALAAFVTAMNEKAAALGLADTQFANPDGDDDDDAWSTAHDVALMYAALHADPALADLAALPDYAFTSVGPEATPYAAASTNQLIGQHGVLSAKTGSTEAAGGCVVLARTMPGGDGTEVVAILGAELAYDETWTPTVDERWNDAVAVMGAIDAGWTPGQNLAAPATEPPLAAVPAGDSTRQEAQPRSEVTEDVAPAGSRADPLLVVTITSGVLACAGVFAWSRVASPRHRHLPVDRSAARPSMLGLRDS